VTVRRDGEELPVMVTRRTAFNVFWSSSAWNKTPVHNAWGTVVDGMIGALPGAISGKGKDGRA